MVGKVERVKMECNGVTKDFMCRECNEVTSIRLHPLIKFRGLHDLAKQLWYLNADELGLIVTGTCGKCAEVKEGGNNG